MGEFMDKIKHFKIELDDKIRKCNSIFILGHNDPDFDSIASCIGMSEYSNEFNKNNYIVVNDKDIDIDSGVKNIIDISRNKYNYIDKNKAIEFIDDNSILIICDVNQQYRISLGDCLDKFKNIFVIDHHIDNDNIKSDGLVSKRKYVNDKASSASEMVTDLLELSHVNYGEFVANVLFAGIRLDTKRFIKNTTTKTYDMIKRLLFHGANPDKINRLFLSEFEEESIICKLIYNNGNTLFSKYSENIFKEYNLSFTVNREMPDTNYKKVYIAKAADKMLKIKMIDASFVIGKTSNGTVVSARSMGEFNVGNILCKLEHGGGNSTSAGAVSDLEPLALESKTKTIIENSLSCYYEKTDIYPSKVVKK